MEIFKKNLIGKMVGKKQPISWKFSLQISPGSNKFCSDLTNIFNIVYGLNPGVSVVRIV